MTEVSIYEGLLSGGHPNSLGNTVEVVAAVGDNPDLLTELIATYASDDPVVRLRVSSALKRVAADHPGMVHDALAGIMAWVRDIDQPSAWWSLSQLFHALKDLLSASEYTDALELMKSVLTTHDDWIVINQTLGTLGEWARTDESLRHWLLPVLEEFTHEARVSISKRAQRYLTQLA